MSVIKIDIHGEPITPKRGDLVQTNIGKSRERTWFVLSSRSTRPVLGLPRFRLWVERWWEIEPETRMALFRTAERAGGQRVIGFARYPAKKKNAPRRLPYY